MLLPGNEKSDVGLLKLSLQLLLAQLLLLLLLLEFDNEILHARQLLLLLLMQQLLLILLTNDMDVRIMSDNRFSENCRAFTLNRTLDAATHEAALLLGGDVCIRSPLVGGTYVGADGLGDEAPIRTTCSKLITLDKNSPNASTSTRNCNTSEPPSVRSATARGSRAGANGTAAGHK